LLSCATCCATQQQPITDVQQKFRSKVAQQKSATKVYVCHQGKRESEKVSEIRCRANEILNLESLAGVVTPTTAANVTYFFLE